MSDGVCEMRFIYLFIMRCSPLRRLCVLAESRWCGAVYEQTNGLLYLLSCLPQVPRNGGKVHSFGKREQAIKRNPNMPVVVRGWLYKQVRGAWNIE